MVRGLEMDQDLEKMVREQYIGMHPVMAPAPVMGLELIMVMGLDLVLVEVWDLKLWDLKFMNTSLINDFKGLMAGNSLHAYLFEDGICSGRGSYNGDGYCYGGGDGCGSGFESGWGLGTGNGAGTGEGYCDRC